MRAIKFITMGTPRMNRTKATPGDQGTIPTSLHRDKRYEASAEETVPWVRDKGESHQAKAAECSNQGEEQGEPEYCDL